MLTDVRKLDVLIASPGDAGAARNIIERALHDWNDHRADAEHVILRPRRWETGSIPVLGRGGAQSVINSQLVDGADIVFAVFYHRLGSPTPSAVSGTAEEIARSVHARKPVHLYFAEKRLPYDADLEQFRALRDFRHEMQKLGLIATFTEESELATAVTAAIEYDVRTLKDAKEPSNRKRPPVSRPKAAPTAIKRLIEVEYVRRLRQRSQAKVKVTSRYRDSINVANWTAHSLDQLTLTCDGSLGGSDPIKLVGPSYLPAASIGTFHPPAGKMFRVVRPGGRSDEMYVRVHVNWKLNGEMVRASFDAKPPDPAK